MTTNKPDVKRYDCTSEDSYHCHGCFTMKEQPRGDYVEWEDYEALQADYERLRKHLQNLIDQTTPLEPEPGNPMWSRRIQLDEVMAERDKLRVECGKLAESLELFVPNPTPTGEDFDKARAALATYRNQGENQ